MRTPRNIFIINLAISDLTLCHENASQHLHHQPGHLRPNSLPLHAAVHSAKGTDTELATRRIHVQVRADVLWRQRVRVDNQHHRHRP